MCPSDTLVRVKLWRLTYCVSFFFLHLRPMFNKNYSLIPMVKKFIQITECAH